MRMESILFLIKWRTTPRASTRKSKNDTLTTSSWKLLFSGDFHLWSLSLWFNGRNSVIFFLGWEQVCLLVCIDKTWFFLFMHFQNVNILFSCLLLRTGTFSFYLLHLLIKIRLLKLQKFYPKWLFFSNHSHEQCLFHDPSLQTQSSCLCSHLDIISHTFPWHKYKTPIQSPCTPTFFQFW